MPEIQLKYRHPISRELVDALAAGLPAIVASNLTCKDEGGELTPEDVEVEIIEMRPDTHHTRYDLQIKIDANIYPSRLKSIDARRERICIEVESFVEGVCESMGKPYLESKSGFVWVRLSPGSFSEIF